MPHQVWRLCLDSNMQPEMHARRGSSSILQQPFMSLRQLPAHKMPHYTNCTNLTMPWKLLTTAPSGVRLMPVISELEAALGMEKKLRPAHTGITGQQ